MKARPDPVSRSPDSSSRALTCHTPRRGPLRDTAGDPSRRRHWQKVGPCTPPTAGRGERYAPRVNEERSLHDDVRSAWDELAAFWDERMEAGATWQRHLIQPSVERLLRLEPGERVLEIACGNGEFARRMSELGGHGPRDRFQRGDARAGSRARRGRRVPVRRRDGRGGSARARRAGVVRCGGQQHGDHGHGVHRADGGGVLAAPEAGRPLRLLDTSSRVQLGRRAADGRARSWRRRDRDLLGQGVVLRAIVQREGRRAVPASPSSSGTSTDRSG